MALPLLNNAESQLSGTTVLTSNQGVGGNNPFDEAVIGANMTLTNDSLHPAHATNAFKVALTSTTTAITYMGWTSVSIGATRTRIFGAFYMFSPTAVPSSIRLVGFYSGATLAGYLGCNNTLAGFQFRSSADATIGTVAGPIAASTLYRIEFDVSFGASVAGTVNVYLGDSTTLFKTGGFTATAFGTNFDHIRFGCVTANFASTAGAAYWLDDLNVNATGLPGPGPYGGAVVSTVKKLAAMGVG